MIRHAICASAVLIAAAPALAAGPATGRPLDCFADLMHGSSEQIVCDFPLKPSTSERADLEKQSRGYVKDAQCTVSVRIARALVKQAIDTPHFQFDAPPQAVQCTVTAHFRDKDPPTTVPITATFAPKVTIRDSKAIDATPGLGDVTGVPRALSWPVEAWVNSGIGIKSNMLLVINAWLDHMRRTTHAGR